MISEEVGVAKPNKKIFDYALEQAGNPDRSRVLMVGDTAESDILGGINAGLATCWLNAPIASNQKASRPPGPFLRCTNWSSSCVNTDCLPPVDG